MGAVPLDLGKSRAWPSANFESAGGWRRLLAASRQSSACTERMFGKARGWAMTNRARIL